MAYKESHILLLKSYFAGVGASKYKDLALIVSNKVNYTYKLIYANIKYAFCDIKPLGVMYIWRVTLVTRHFCAVSTSKSEDSRHYWIDIKSHCHVCNLSLIPTFWGLACSKIVKVIKPRVTLVTHQLFFAFSGTVILIDIQGCSFLMNFKGNILPYQNKRF